MTADWPALGPESFAPLNDNEGLAEAADPYTWFNQTDTLRTIRQWAFSVRVSPWAALITVLARFSADIPPGVVLPGIGGGPVGSLNTYAVLVGPPGSGKSSLVRALDDQFMPRPLFEDHVTKFAPGSSGEGIPSQFVTASVKDGQVAFTRIGHQAFGVIDEIGLLEETAARQGNTVLGVLRQLWSGEFYENSVATRERQRRLESQTYRLSVLMGAQPGIGEVLFNKTAKLTGFTHRLLFAEVRDPMRVVGSVLPDAPPPLVPIIHPRIPFPANRQTVIGHRVPYSPQVHCVIDVEPLIHEYMILEEDKARAGEAGAISGHRMFLQLRLAAVLAILHGHDAVTREWFDMVDEIMLQSDAGLAVMMRAHYLSMRSEKEAAAREQGELSVVTEDAKVRALVPVVLDVAKDHHDRKLHADGLCVKKCFRPRMRRNLEMIDDALAAAVKREQLVEVPMTIARHGAIIKWRLP